jgi:hypothetical protein
MAARKTSKQPEFSPEELQQFPIDRELSQLARGFEVRIVADGRVVCQVSPKKFSTWPSREVFVEWWKAAYAKAARPIDYTVTHLPPFDEFLRDVEAHAKALGPRLGIPDGGLDGTVASLEAVDRALERIHPQDRLVPDLVTPLVAYVGEVMRKASGGWWIKHPPKNEPFIKTPNGWGFQPFAEVLIPMVEPSKRPPLRDAVAIQLTMGGYPGAR